mmetsp:Transcript_11142/g.26863  ORF Transcript_11142/g.26863 Transcript_11142/m.26863 type:complete len:125 (-) Transcript_11142:295-669(-)
MSTEGRLGIMHSETAKAHELLGQAFLSLDNTAKALSHLEKSVEIMKAVGSDPYDEIVPALTLLGRLHFKDGDLFSSKDCFRQAVSIQETKFEHYDVEVMDPLKWLNFVWLKISVEETEDGQCGP